MNNEIKEFNKKILPINIIVLFIVLIVLLILQKYTWLLGYLLGSLTSYITYLMHVNNVKQIDGNIRHPQRNAFSKAILRLSISAIALLIALFVEMIDIIATFIGLLVIKVIILFTAIILEVIKSKKEVDV
jgi:F0F1-type ATP synthase assembly protein I